MALKFFEKLKDQMTKTREGLKGKIDDLVKSFQKVDEDFFDELEEILIMADLGVDTTMELVDYLREVSRKEKILDTETLKERLKEELVAKLNKEEFQTEETYPVVYLIVGVNGVGKTTTIGKLAHLYEEQGKSVVLAAADTFRAAAIDQLEVWANRVKVPLVKHQPGADPGSVIFDAIQSAKSKKADVLICDTAGRLHNKVNLMNELKKLNKIITSEYPEARREVILVLDATTGQNAISQTKLFTEAVDLTGLIMTKMDGTAKGGILISLCTNFEIPVKFIGIGEQMDDFEQFRADEFVNAIL